ncbi:MAG TPA: 50S ribosomal protein L15 [Candidatus Saccharimonadales bacterium]|nr:50S ribosomal protein L15 [Candidatus Saccharimonadales bacterium]
MKLNEMAPHKGSRHSTRRVGRGTGAGQGKTAGKGTKGQLARSGPGLPGWFEGGQTPLHMRIPKLRGFRNRQRLEYIAVNVDQLDTYAVDGKVSPDTLAAKGLIGSDARIKVLGNGSLATKLEVHAHRASATAREKIEAAGGTLVLITETVIPRQTAYGATRE